MESSELTQVRALVEGRVQGVGFRHFVRQAAKAMGLVGWVRNLSDGRVELLVEGTRKDCDDLLSLVKQGPSMSEVGQIETVWGKPTWDEKSFRVAPTSSNPS